VLVRPEAPVNVGAAARIVRNTGLSGLDLVAPGDWRTVECWRTAWGAQDVLEQARVFATLDEAVADAAYVVAFSGRRPGGVPALDVREAAQEVKGLDPADGAALVFGPETTGLSEAELAGCGRRAVIPSHRDQPSLNLSHAVMVAAYEVYRAGRRPLATVRRARAGEKQTLLALLRDGLRALEALPARNTDGYFEEWRALFMRADLTPRELKLLEHMARKMAQLAAAPARPREAAGSRRGR
jgi:tRNA (cytidine32/uridine32-2'-O)-methyltransferase